MRRDPRPAFIAALACLGGLIVTGVTALLLPPAQARDSVALQGFTHLDRGRLAEWATWIAHLCDPLGYGLFGAGLIGVALLRRRYHVAMALPVVLVGSGLTTHLLKPLLATQRPSAWPDAIGAAAWPSGHATAALTLALCAVLVAPRRWRPAAAVLGAAFASAVAYAILVLAWHFPSDVLGGFLVAAMWVLTAVGVLVALERRPAPVAAGAPPVTWPVVVLGAVGAAVALPAARRHGDMLAYARDHEFTFVVGGSIAALALALLMTVARAARS